MGHRDHPVRREQMVTRVTQGIRVNPVLMVMMFSWNRNQTYHVLFVLLDHQDHGNQDFQFLTILIFYFSN